MTMTSATKQLKPDPQYILITEQGSTQRGKKSRLTPDRGYRKHSGKAVTITAVINPAWSK